MKTYTLEELKLAQAKGCRIEYSYMCGDWYLFEYSLDEPHDWDFRFRIHPADEWKARLPRLRDGAKWHRNDFTNEILECGYRPHLLGETGEGEYLSNGKWKQDGPSTSHHRTTKHCQHTRTRRPVPPEFLHQDELAQQPEAFTKGQKVSVDWHDPHGDGSYAGDGEFIRHLEKGDVGDELLKDGPHVVVKCTPDDFGSIFPLSAVKVIQRAAPQTDTPETDRISKVCGSFEQFIAEFESMERRAIVAEARVKELEAANAELIQRLQERVESYLAAARRDVQTIQQQAVELDRLRAAIRLRPIAEAGPVPDGMVRVYAERYLNEEWLFAEKPCESDTHFIDIYPPQ